MEQEPKTVEQHMWGWEEERKWCFVHPKAYYVTPIIAIKNKLKAIEAMKRNSATFDTPSLLESFPLKQFPTAQELYQRQIEYDSLD